MQEHFVLKLGPDTVGIALGLLTIPMVLLSIGSVAAGLMLAVMQDWGSLLFGAGAFLFCSVLAPLLEKLVVAIDDAAVLALQQGHRRRAHGIAIVSGALPILAIFVLEIAAWRWAIAGSSPTPTVLHLIWGYGVATGPWSFFALRVSRFRRTLVGIRAYSGQVALWLFLLLTLWLNAPPLVIVAVLLLVPTGLPIVLGMQLALADRDAIANVRV